MDQLMKQHGNPVNFMAIAYGICDDDTRKKTILVTSKYNGKEIFFLAICLYSYNTGEEMTGQFPFQIMKMAIFFLSWDQCCKSLRFLQNRTGFEICKRCIVAVWRKMTGFPKIWTFEQDGLGDDIFQ